MDTNACLDVAGHGDTHNDADRIHRDSHHAQTTASAAMPPLMAKANATSVDELVQEMNRIPLFMTTLDDSDGAGGENVELEALKALAYEGTRAEIAQNFRDQGTELVRYEKRYAEAREYYSKALQALQSPPPEPNPEQGPKVVEMDDEAETAKERAIREACLVNRALCHLEMKNYGSCNRDCAAALRLNPRNIKAWYRAATACLALDKLAEALDACRSGLALDAQNAALRALHTACTQRQHHLAQLAAERSARAQRAREEAATLQRELRGRGVLTRRTARPLEMPEAAVALEDPRDESSELCFPVMFLYPLHAQTDFVARVGESETLLEHLAYILPTPWDGEGEYAPERVECYMETVAGGLVKAGKKLSLIRLLGSGKVEVVDDVVRVNVVPQAKATQWLEEFKKRRGKS